MPPKTTPKPPTNLGAAGKQFWAETVAVYVMESPDLARLAIACDALDRIADARLVLSKGADRNAMNAWRDASKIFLATLKHLGVDKADEPRKPRSAK